jgi:zinc protease
MKRCLRMRAGLLFAFVAAIGLAASSAEGIGASAAGGVAHRVLPNGLEVFVAENHAVPLVTVSVAFRGGAIAQSPETSGLFHLYEHMLFTSNEKYPNQAAFTGALNKMGVANWNGATGTEYINYYITVPSDKLADGIEFWSWAVKKPLFDAEKLKSEKDVVINEIRGYHSDPDEIMENAISSRAFSAFPWRKNIDGPEETVKNATLEQLESMRAQFYIPKNAALFIGGDVSPEAAFSLVDKWFGDWQGGEASRVAEEPQKPFASDLRLVYPDDTFYDGIGQAELVWRGPDSLRQTKDTYTSDVFLYLLSSPVGRFKQDLMKACPGLYDPEYISFSYPTSRDGGAYYFSTYLLLDHPEKRGPTLDRVSALEAAVEGEFALIAKDPEAYFGPEELAKAKAKLIDQNLLSTEVASSYVTSTLNFWWAVATTDYFFGYEANCGKVSFGDIQSLIANYLVGRPRVSALRLKSDAYASEGDMAQKAKAQGYVEVSADNAFWWQAK